MIIEKPCRRCGATIRLVPDPSCPDHQAGQLAASVLYCDRCADYGWERSQVLHQIAREANALVTVRSKPKRTDDDEAAIRSCVESIARLCRAFAGRCCEFYRVQLVWDQEFPTMLCQQPDKLKTVIGMYEQGIRHIAKQLPA